jgi:hypothetical protein
LPRLRYFVLTVMVGLLAPSGYATPAQAASIDAYYGNRGHAWTNLAQDRIGVEDQRDDGIRIFVVAFATDGNDEKWLQKFDENNNSPGYSVLLVPRGDHLQFIYVCGIWNGASVQRGCGSIVDANPFPNP